MYSETAKKDTGRLATRINLRLRVFAAITAGIMVLIVGYAAVRSAMTNKEYSIRALSQMSGSSSTLVAKSGEIYDSNMTPLAVSNRVYILILDPKVIMQTDTYEENGETKSNGTLELTANAVALCFGLDAQEIKEAIQADTESMYLRFVSENSGSTSKKTLVSEEQKELFDALEEKVNASSKKVLVEELEELKNQAAEEMTAQIADESTSLVETSTESVTETAKAAEEAGEKTEKHKPEIAGVWFETEYQRYYPYNDLASKVVGFTTKDSTEGIWGLERYYNEELRGTNGRSYSYIDESDNLIREVIEPTDGYSIVSTIDINLTKLISEAVEDWFNETDENGEKIRSAKECSILAMDPNTGAVKAMVSSTDYDLNNPSDLSDFYTDEELAVFEYNQEKYDEYEAWAEAEKEEGTEAVTETVTETESESASGIGKVVSPYDIDDTASSDDIDGAASSPYDMYLSDDGGWDHDAYPTTSDVQNTIWRNGIISNSFEPGSTGKIITYAAALEEGVITKDTIFDDSEGFLQIGSTIVKCHNYATGGCKVINSMEAMAQSCNVAFMEIGKSLGAHNFAKYQQLHNLGQKTGIDLPGEASCEGLLYTEDQLGELELATNSFGQCYNVTMIQLAAAFCADINGGYYYKPYVVQSILDADGKVVESTEPALVRQVISEETSAIIRDTLEYTVTNGTAYGVQVGNMEEGILMEGYHFGGKTGTAQKLPRSEEKYVLSLISAAPMTSPQLVLYVVIDEYEGYLKEDGSAPVQYLSGLLWYAIKDYIGLYSELDPDVDTYEWEEETSEAQAVEAVDDGMQEGNAILSDSDGNSAAIPVPPTVSSQDTEEEVQDPDSIISPEDAIAAPE